MCTGEWLKIRNKVIVIEVDQYKVLDKTIELMNNALYIQVLRLYFTDETSLHVII